MFKLAMRLIQKAKAEMLCLLVYLEQLQLQKDWLLVLVKKSRVVAQKNFQLKQELVLAELNLWAQKEIHLFGVLRVRILLMR